MFGCQDTRTYGIDRTVHRQRIRGCTYKNWARKFQLYIVPENARSIEASDQMYWYIPKLMKMAMWGLVDCPMWLEGGEMRQQNRRKWKHEVAVVQSGPSMQGIHAKIDPRSTGKRFAVVKRPPCSGSISDFSSAWIAPRPGTMAELVWLGGARQSVLNEADRLCKITQ